MSIGWRSTAGAAGVAESLCQDHPDEAAGGIGRHIQNFRAAAWDERLVELVTDAVKHGKGDG